MLRPRLILTTRIVNFAPFTMFTVLAFGLSLLPVAVAAALPAGSEPASVTEQPDSQQQAEAEISIEAERQTALAKQTMIISETPDAGPQSKRLSVVVGLGASVGPVYAGSEVTRVAPIPYVDVRGLLGGRLYISDVNGLGLNLVDTGSFRAGLNVGDAAGRKSNVAAHLRGLPDIGEAASIGGFVAYWSKPFAFQATLAHRVGSHPGTAASLGSTYSVSPLPNLQLTFSTSVSWANASSLNTFFGISPAAAAHTVAIGNPLPPYTARSGLFNVSATFAAVYMLGDHWGLVGRVGLVDLIGNSVNDSPLTQRSFQPNAQIGILYVF
jgi:outer membrane scaffolding protein for murein synthesis (MipA/OmpV family)